MNDGRTGGQADGRTKREIAGRVAAVFALGALATAYWWGPIPLRRLNFFGVRRVEVSGTRYLAPEVVVRALSLGAAANVFDDLGTMTRRLESLGGIARARVTRKLPSTLVVEVTEVEPVAMAAGPEGLIPLAPDARPLPYDVVRAPVDAPIVRDADPTLLESLSRVQTADLGLYGDVVAARANGSELVLDLAGGRMRLRMPVDPVVVRKLSLVRGDLAAHGREWSELEQAVGRGAAEAHIGVL